MRNLRALGALALAVIALGLIGGLTRISWRPAGADGSALRLAWRARSVRVEICHQRSPEELVRLPVHMREAEVCDGQLLPYRLRVAVDDAPAADDTVRPAGAREDRPLYVYREIPIAPGRHRLSVRFERLGEAPAEAAEPRPEDRREGRTAPALLQLDTTATVAAGGVLLVSYDEDRQALFLRRPGPP